MKISMEARFRDKTTVGDEHIIVMHYEGGDEWNVKQERKELDVHWIEGSCAVANRFIAAIDGTRVLFCNECGIAYMVDDSKPSDIKVFRLDRQDIQHALVRYVEQMNKRPIGSAESVAS